MKKSSHQNAAVLTGLILISFLLALGQLTAGHNWGGDFAQYIMQAQSMVDGTMDSFMQANRATMEQSYRPVGPVAYPWGFPLLLAPLYAWMGINLTAFKLAGVLSYVAFLWVYSRYLRGQHLASASTLLVALFALNPTMLGFLNQITSDIPFMLVSTATIWLLMTGTGSRPDSLTRAILIGLFIGFAGMVRTNGILLLIPLAARQYGCWRELRRTSPIVPAENSRSLLGGLIMPWLMVGCVMFISSVWLPEGGSSHVGHLTAVTWQTILDNTYYYLKLPLAFFEGVPGRPFICMLIIFISVIGAAVRLRSDYPVILYVLATMGIYVIWPDAIQGLRFLFPVLPFLFAYAVIGFLAVCSRLPGPGKNAARACGLGFFLYMLTAMGVTSAGRVLDNQRHGRPAPEGPYTEASQKLFAEIIQITSADDHVVFFKPGVMRFMTGRPSTIQRNVSQVPDGAFVVIYRDPDGQVWPMPPESLTEATLSGHATLRYHDGPFEVYRVDR